MSDVSIRPKTAADDEWIVGLRNRIHDHLPPMSVEAFRYFETLDDLSDQAHTERLVAERHNRRVGSVVIEKMWWVERPDGYFVRLVVEPELWGQGIGSSLFEWLIGRLRQLEANRLYSNVRRDKPHSQSFASKRGFEMTGHADRWSRLNVTGANLDGYKGVGEKLASHGITIKTLVQVGESEEFLRKLHRVNDEAVRDIPMSENFTETPFEFFMKELHEPQSSLDRVWVALDGEDPVGLAILPLPNPASAFNAFTGVKREYRGKGVARALKFKTIQWCLENGVEYIYTANDVTNQRMLSINNSLGYEELPISEEVVLNLS